jgi:ribosomal protein S27E
MTGATCQHCGTALFRRTGGKIKLRVQSRILSFDPEGGASMVCPECGEDTAVSLTLPPDAVPAEEPEAKHDPRPVRILQLQPGLVRRFRDSVDPSDSSDSKKP